jgi:hypothetical protein
MPTEVYPTSKTRENPVSDDETVAKMGHTDCDCLIGLRELNISIERFLDS